MGILKKRSNNRMFVPGDQRKSINKEVALNVTDAGAPIVDRAVIVRNAKDIVCVCIGLDSKYVDADFSFIDNDGACGIHITANKKSLYLRKGIKRNMPTRVVFSDFIGWDVFATGSGRYSIYVCLIRKEN